VLGLLLCYVTMLCRRAVGSHTLNRGLKPISGCVRLRWELSPQVCTGLKQAAHFLWYVLLSVLGQRVLIGGCTGSPTLRSL
jgi:hypothetical protein